MAHKLFGGQFGLIEIAARQTVPADADFALCACGDGLQVAIQQVNTPVGGGGSDGDT